jgi:hypothetical protein
MARTGDRDRDPLAATDRLLVDGSNLLHAMREGPGSEPPSAVIGRLRGVVPANVGIELVLDGTPDPGMRGSRIASGLIVRHAGRRSADALLLALVDEARRATGERHDAVDNILVVTDDRELREQLRRRGARTAGTRWLIGRLDRRRVESPGTGNRRGPTPQSVADTSAAADPDDRTGWKPGRGATVKRGNPWKRRRNTGT